MKITASYLLLFNLLFLTSCQEQYSEVEIQQQVLWNETIQRTNLILKRNVSTKIKKAIKDIETKTQYEPFLPKFKYITTQSDRVFNEIERLKHTLLEYSEAHALATATFPTKALTKNIQSIYNNYIYLIEKSWDNGGIKGSIFADIHRKESAIQEVKASLDLPFLSQIRADSAYLERQLKDKPVAAVLTFLSSIQNDIRKQESHVFHFFSRQIGMLCNFGSSPEFGLHIRPNKYSIRLGQMYQTEIFMGNYPNNSFHSVAINGERIPLLNEKTTYTVKPSQTGKQAYRPTITFLNSYTNLIDSLEQTFYFDVID